MPETPEIYLSYAQPDEARAEAVYERLLEAGFRPWIYSRDIRPGEEWRQRSAEVIRRADFFLPLLSSYWAPTRHSQKEADLALEVARTDRAGRIYLIPVLLEPCTVPEGLRDYRWVELFKEEGWAQLLRAVERAPAPQSLPPPKPPDDLVRACATGECVLYVGAGLSAPMGLPMWGPLVERLLGWAESRQVIRPRLLESLRQSLTAGQYDLVADSVFEATREIDQQTQTSGTPAGLQTQLLSYLKELFVAPDAAPGPNHSRIRDTGFAAILTTNFDNLLEGTFPNSPVYTPQDTEPLLNALSGRQFFLLKLYGTLARPETVLVAPRQYEDAIVGNQAFSQFTEGLFVSRTLLFVGASLNGIEAYLRGVKFRGNLSRRHYALVSVRDSTWQARAEALRRRYQIQVLPYDGSPDHQEVDAFLEELLRGVRGEKGGRPEAVPGRRKPLWLKRLCLENVGPFGKLDLELQQQWNVLLGNNGVGKSNVLRGAAAALCGREAQNSADRLVKYGATAAKVILQTSEGKEYVTEFYRTSGEPDIKCFPTRLLEAEGWLALGFSALRMVSWQQAKGPQLEEGKRRPTPDDLLPLVVGGPDPRVDQLKQWIVNLDYRIKSEPGDRGARYERLLKDFFEVINRLTGELRVEFKGVDVSRGRVLLETDDGEVPLEAVSQGTVSLLGWVGVLMQRLYEVYDEEKEPRCQYALVLMDEIDAHMHPEWQQGLVPVLGELFPNVQFLATTHSPLIVGGMPAEQVFRFARQDGGRIERVEVESDETMGRADQILTSGLFGLETTLDRLTQEEIKKYQRLLGKTSRTPEEEAEFRRLQDTLAFRLPHPYEGPVERRAQELLQALLRSQVGDKHPEAQRELLAKAEQLFKELSQRRKGP
jgi:predicted ATPase